MTAQQDLLDRIALAGETDCAGVSSGALSVEGLADLRDFAPEIAAAWLAIGAPKPEPAPATARGCAVNACRAMAFVRIKTAHGLRSLCLEHWQESELAVA